MQPANTCTPSETFTRDETTASGSITVTNLNPLFLSLSVIFHRPRWPGRTPTPLISRIASIEKVSSASSPPITGIPTTFSNLIYAGSTIPSIWLPDFRKDSITTRLWPPPPIMNSFVLTRVILFAHLPRRNALKLYPTISNIPSG
jgi:hypothetical protein